MVCLRMIPMGQMFYVDWTGRKLDVDIDIDCNVHAFAL